MNWYKESQEKIPAEQVGYSKDWGEHHGDVETKLDMFNFGPSGYPKSSPPMPLPKTLYHVTPFADKIQEEGFKMFKNPEEQTFGGHGEYVSFTSLENAKIYQEGLKDYIRMTKIPLESNNIENMLNKLLPFMKKWKVKSAWLDAIKKDYNFDQDLAKSLYNNLGSMFIFSEAGFPIFAHSGMTSPRLSKLDPDDVKIIEVSTVPNTWHSGVNTFMDDMKDRYTYNAYENEWRIYNPNNVNIISILE